MLKLLSLFPNVMCLKLFFHTICIMKSLSKGGKVLKLPKRYNTFMLKELASILGTLHSRYMTCTVIIKCALILCICIMYIFKDRFSFFFCKERIFLTIGTQTDKNKYE